MNRYVCILNELSFHSLEVGICIAVQVCMLQIPILVLFNAFYVRHPFFIFIDSFILTPAVCSGIVSGIKHHLCFG